MITIMRNFKVTTSGGATTTISAMSKSACHRAVGGRIIAIEEVKPIHKVEIEPKFGTSRRPS